MYRNLYSFLALFLLVGASAGAEEELPEHAIPVLRNWLYQNEDVVEVCVFREKWVAPTNDFPKGILLRYGTITRVHKGKLSVGDKVYLTSYIEFPAKEWKQEAKLRPDRVSLVDGELVVAMFSASDTKKTDGYWDVGDGVCRFSFDDYFYRAFQSELRRDRSLKGEAN